MCNEEQLIELNKRALELDAELKAIKRQVSDLVESDFKSDDTLKIQKTAQLITADCLSYYRYRMYTKIEQLKNKE